MESFKLFDDLYHLLEQYRLGEGRPFSTLSPRNQESLSFRMAHYFKENLRPIIELIESSTGIVLRFDDYNPKWKRLPKITRKALFYSDISVVLLDGQIDVFGGDYRAPTKKGSRKIPKYVKATNMAEVVEALYRIRPLVQRGIVVPLPGAMKFHGFSPGTGGEIGSYYDLLDRLKHGNLRHNAVVPVELDEWRVKRQIEELAEGNSNYDRLRPIHLYLPHLRTLSADLLLGIREDNYDAFMRFQAALRHFMTQAAIIRSESQFLDLARHVDHEICELQARVDTISRVQRSKGWELAGGLIASSLTIMADSEIARLIGALISSSTVFDGLKFFTERRGDKRLLEDSDYYLAYKVQRIATGTDSV